MFRDEPTERKTVSTGRACKPSLSNGYSCPSTSPSANGTYREKPAKTTASKPDRGCRPSLSNGYKCPGTSTSSEAPSGAYQYATDGQARARCPTDTVVWLNTRSNIYHFGGTRNSKRYFGGIPEATFSYELRQTRVGDHAHVEAATKATGPVESSDSRARASKVSRRH